MTDADPRPGVVENDLRLLATALGFNYESTIAPVRQQIITVGDVRRALHKYPGLAEAVQTTATPNEEKEAP